MRTSKARRRVLTYIGVSLTGLVVAGASALAYFRPVLSVDETNLPRFVTHDILDPTAIGSVSRFRSGYGHSYTSGDETCRSMKQYFMPPTESGFFDGNATPPSDIDPATNVPVYSPVAGTITKVQSEQSNLGKQITIRSSEHQAYTFKLFHIFPLSEVSAGQKVAPGERIGSKLPSQVVDVAVEVATIKNGSVLVPYTSLLGENLFISNYAGRGGGSPQNFTISRQTRDADPFTCSGESFVYPNYGNVESGAKQRESKNFVTLGKVL